MRLSELVRDHFDPADPARRVLRMDQLVLNARNSAHSTMTYPFSVPLIGLAAAQWADPWLVTAWVLAIFAIVYVMHRGALRVVADAGRPETLKRHAIAMVATGGLFISSLGGSALLFWEHGDPLNHMLFIVLLGVSMAIAAAQTATFLPQGLCSLLYGVIGIVCVLSEGGTLYYVMSILCVVAMAMVFSVVVNVNAMGEKTITLSRAQDALVERLTRANAAKSEFLANMSHELRTPLNAIIGFSDVMRQELIGPVGTPAYKGYLDDIHFSGNHLLSLINDILDLSKIEAGKFELREEPVDFFELIEETGALIRLRATEAGIRIVNDVPPGVIVHGDHRALRQVAVNLATNAIKFTPRGGEVRASHFVDANGDICFQLADTGRGIHPGDLERVFESFGQGRHDHATRERGTGLGLPIVRGLVRAHGGDVTLASELGKGTTVTIRLPASRLIRMGDQAAA
jgi:two-component system, cell cycle sensor histidine kinase PleC